jgi:hypothetical protein
MILSVKCSRRTRVTHGFGGFLRARVFCEYLSLLDLISSSVEITDE